MLRNVRRASWRGTNTFCAWTMAAWALLLFVAMEWAMGRWVDGMGSVAGYGRNGRMQPDWGKRRWHRSTGAAAKEKGEWQQRKSCRRNYYCNATYEHEDPIDPIIFLTPKCTTQLQTHNPTQPKPKLHYTNTTQTLHNRTNQNRTQNPRNGARASFLCPSAPPLLAPSPPSLSPVSWFQFLHSNERGKSPPYSVPFPLLFHKTKPPPPPGLCLHNSSLIWLTKGLFRMN